VSSTTTPWWQQSAVALAAAYRRNEVSPVQVLGDCWARIEAVNPRLNALVALRREAAFDDAARSAERFARGAPLGWLDGIPLAVKDNIPSADLPTTWGSPAGRDHQPVHDELALARARAGGAVVVGKTNVPEFTLEGYTSNPLFGTTRNPWNPALTPGGSSGGSVAAVAAGMVPLALGTDGGGSTRRPASHTGLVGLKPSIGAIAREHALPPLLLDFEVIGPIARSVADVQLLFDALRGPHPADRRSLAAVTAKPLPPTLKVLYVPTLAGAPVDAEVARSCRAGAQRLAALGHEVQEGELPLDLGFMTNGWSMVGQIGLSWLFAHHPQWRAGASPSYGAMAEAGARRPAADLWQVLETVEQLRRDVAQLFTRFDLLVTPAAAALPWPADEAYPPVIAGQPVGPRGHAIFTGWVNAAGLPAVAMPCEPSSTGLPIGVQLISDFGSDVALLALAAQFEAAAPQAWRWPSL
jgi:aspartyl-tRNA(Asn)/glutamyl-tRNA(Gln) amidotransferase subunit A